MSTCNIQYGWVIGLNESVFYLCVIDEDVMATLDKQIRGLNDVQLSLLRMFNRKMSYEESVELRDLLTRHYSQKMKDEVNRVIGEKGITSKDYDKLRR